MAELMANRPVKINRLKEGRGRRHLDVVGAGDVEGAVAADADIGAGRTDQRLGLRQDQVFGERFRRWRDRGRKILALVGIKDREAFEEWDGVGFVAGFGGARAFAVRNEAVGIDDRGAAFALLHMGADFQRLAKGEPVLAGKAALGDGAPQDQDVDAAIGARGRGVFRQAERGGHSGPGLHPRHAPLLEFGDDLVSDLLVQAGAVGKRFVRRCGMGHGRSLRRAGESLSPAWCARHRPRTALFLSRFRQSRAVFVRAGRPGLPAGPRQRIATRQGGDVPPERGGKGARLRASRESGGVRARPERSEGDAKAKLVDRIRIQQVALFIVVLVSA